MGKAHVPLFLSVYTYLVTDTLLLDLKSRSQLPPQSRSSSSSSSFPYFRPGAISHYMTGEAAAISSVPESSETTQCSTTITRIGGQGSRTFISQSAPVGYSRWSRLEGDSDSDGSCLASHLYVRAHAQLGNAYVFIQADACASRPRKGDDSQTREWGGQRTGVQVSRVSCVTAAALLCDLCAPVG